MVLVSSLSSLAEVEMLIYVCVVSQVHAALGKQLRRFFLTSMFLTLPYQFLCRKNVYLHEQPRRSNTSTCEAT